MLSSRPAFGRHCLHHLRWIFRIDWGIRSGYFPRGRLPVEDKSARQQSRLDQAVPGKVLVCVAGERSSGSREARDSGAECPMAWLCCFSGAAPAKHDNLIVCQPPKSWKGPGSHDPRSSPLNRYRLGSLPLRPGHPDQGLSVKCSHDVYFFNFLLRPLPAVHPFSPSDNLKPHPTPQGSRGNLLNWPFILDVFGEYVFGSSPKTFTWNSMQQLCCTCNPNAIVIPCSWFCKVGGRSGG